MVVTSIVDNFSRVGLILNIKTRVGVLIKKFKVE